MNIIRQYVTRGVCIKDNKVLLLKKKGESHYFLPGGRVEEGEGYEQALVREISEELDAKANIVEFIGCIEHSFTHYSGKPYYEIGCFFRIEIPEINSKSVKSNELELEFQWMPISELNSINIQPKPVINLINKAQTHENNVFWASTLTTKE